MPKTPVNTIANVGTQPNGSLGYTRPAGNVFDNPVSNGESEFKTRQLNNTALLMVGRSPMSETPQTVPDQQLYDEFMNTIGNYVNMSREEKDFYFRQSGEVAKNGGDAVTWAKDFLTINAIANGLGVSRETVVANLPELTRQYLGKTAKHLEFSDGASIINNWKLGKLRQKMAEAQEELVDLYKKGLGDDDPLIRQAQGKVDRWQREVDAYTDVADHNFIIDWVGSSASQLAYMAEGSAAGAIGSALGFTAGMFFQHPVVGAKIGGTLARIVTYRKQFEAQAFWNMKKAGVPTQVALKYSSLDGLANGLNEALLDFGYNQLLGTVGKAFGIDDLAGKLVPSMIDKATKSMMIPNFIARWLAFVGLDAGGEFIQESTQSLTSALFQYLAEDESNVAYSTTLAAACRDAIQEGVQGWLTGLLFGGIEGVGDAFVDWSRSDTLVNRSKYFPSEETFVNDKENRNILKSMKLGGDALSEDQVTTKLKNLYQSTSEVRNEILANTREKLGEALFEGDTKTMDYYKNRATVVEGDVRDKNGNVISGKGTEVQELPGGGLFYVEDEPSTDEDGKSTHVMRLGNRDVVGTGALHEGLVTAETARSLEEGEGISESAQNFVNTGATLVMEQAGKITFTIDDKTGKLTITGVEIQGDDASLKEKAIRQLASMYAEYDIEWSNRSDSDNAVFSSIESANPRNTPQKSFGLNYIERTFDTKDRSEVKRWIGDNFSKDGAENSMLAMIVQAAASARGMTGMQFIKKYFGDIQSTEGYSFEREAREALAERGVTAPTDEQLQAEINKQRSNTKGFTKTQEIDGQIKAVIYAGKNADPTTFMHELDHAIILMGDNMETFSALMNKVKGTEQFQNFVKANIDILHFIVGKVDDKGKFVRDDKGNYVFDQAKLDKLYTTEKWTRDDFEFESRLAEAFRRSGQTLNPELKGFFRRVAEVFRKVYTALRNGFGNAMLNDEVRDYFDKLYGYDRHVPEGHQYSQHLKSDARMHRIGSLLKQDDIVDISDDAIDENTAKATLADYRKNRTEFKNKDTGAVAELKSDYTKMFSPTAKKETLESGGTYSVHYAAVNNIKNLYENASYLYSEKPRNGSEDIKSYDKYGALFKFDGTNYLAKITVKTYRDSSIKNGVYSVEGISVQKIGTDGINAVIQKHGQELDIDAVNRINALLSKVNGSSLRQTDDRYDSQILAERQAVIDKYQGTDQWLKAPNGKPTNLNEDQWIAVRTDSFKNWFGDWENDPENASKIIDENGEPKVVYHGTSSYGFTVFDKNRNGANTGLGWYGNGFYFDMGNGDKADNYMYSGPGDSMGMYSVFLNIRNPIDWAKLYGDQPYDLGADPGVERFFYDGNEGADWQIGEAPKYMAFWYNLAEKFPGVFTEEMEYYGAKFSAQQVHDLIEKYHNEGSPYPVLKVANELGLDFAAAEDDPFTMYDYVSQFNQLSTIDKLVEQGVVDGVINASQQEDEAVAFDSNQIKSATDNNGHFDSTDNSILRQFSEVEDMSPEEQYEAVKNQYYGTDKYMMAPNGKATNLTERQWIQVRTPNFIRWFGDWLNDPQNASKVVDENGEPKIVYHGTPVYGFDVFDTDEKYAWFANDIRTSRNYAEAKADVYDGLDIAEEFGIDYEPTTGVYSVFLNIRNPLSFGDIEINEAISNEQLAELLNKANNTDVFVADEFDIGTDFYDSPDELFHKLYDGDVAVGANERLRKMGLPVYDGLVVKDNAEINGDLTYAVWDSRQIKSATDNNGMFSLDDNSILMQAGDIESPNFKRWFGNSVVVDDNGKPLELVHGSFDEFDTFGNTTDIGYHFGTMDQAEEVLFNKANENYAYSDATPVFYKVYARIENPIVFSHDMASWTGDNRQFLQELRSEGYLTSGEYAELVRMGDENQLYNDTGDASELNARLKKMLVSKGYDGIIYPNHFEGVTFNQDGTRGYGLSYMVFSPNQVKSSTDNNGEFSLENDSILRQWNDDEYNKNTPLSERRENFKKVMEMGTITESSTPLPFEVIPGDKQSKKQLREWARNNIRGKFTNLQTDTDVFIVGNTIKELTNHDTGASNSDAQMKSLAYVPEIIANMKYIGSMKNEDTKIPTEMFDYFGSFIEIDGTEYFVRSTLVQVDDNRYYDHTLTKKEELRRYLITTQGFSSDSSYLKDIRIVELLQGKSEGKTYREAMRKSFGLDGSSKDPVNGGTSLTQKVDDQEIIDRFNNASPDEYVIAHRSMQLVDGKLYPPMAAVIRGKRQDGLVPGDIVKADENPDLAKPDLYTKDDKYGHKKGEQKVNKKTGRPVYKFDLNKGGYETYPDGTPILYLDKETGKYKPKKLGNVPADYDPYVHSTLSYLNDQFSSAYKRPNLVTVEVKLLKSDLESGYWAEKASLPVGEHAWKTGAVSSALKKYGVKRNLLLSQYCQIVRVIPDSEVADNIAKLLSDKPDVVIPDNTVTPSLLSELKARDVNLSESEEVKLLNEWYERQNSGAETLRQLDTAYEGATTDEMVARRDAIGSLDELKEAAVADVPYMQKLLENIAGKLGMDRDDLFYRNGIKSDASIARKVDGDYHGDFKKLKDITGGTYILDDESAAAAYDAIISNGWVSVYDSKAPKVFNNYHDYKITYYLPNGSVGELIIVDPYIAKMKESAGHKFYDITRVIDDVVNGENNLDEAQMNKILDVRDKLVGMSSMVYTDRSWPLESMLNAWSDVMSVLSSGTDIVTGVSTTLDKLLSVDNMNALRDSILTAHNDRESLPSKAHNVNERYLSRTDLSSISGSSKTIVDDNGDILNQVTVSEEEADEAIEFLNTAYPPEEQKRIGGNLARLKGTPWYHQAITALLVRKDMQSVVEGGDPMKGRALSKYSGDFIDKIRKYGLKEGIFRYVEREDIKIITDPEKARSSVNSSLLECNPSPDCARFCYASTDKNYQYAATICKSELVNIAVKEDPVRAARLAVEQFKRADALASQGVALRMFDKGDFSMDYVPFIKEVNRLGVSVQIFTKRPEFIREIDREFNVAMLSVDKSNRELADQNPDLPLAIVYSGVEDLEFIMSQKERFDRLGGVILPVKLGSDLLGARAVKVLPRWTAPYVCPIDAGTKKANKKDAVNGWSCKKCDKFGAPGCFFHKGADKRNNMFKSIDEMNKGEIDDATEQLKKYLTGTLGIDESRLEGFSGFAADIIGGMLERFRRGPAQTLRNGTGEVNGTSSNGESGTGDKVDTLKQVGDDQWVDEVKELIARHGSDIDAILDEYESGIGANDTADEQGMAGELINSMFMESQTPSEDYPEDYPQDYPDDFTVGEGEANTQEASEVHSWFMADDDTANEVSSIQYVMNDGDMNPAHDLDHPSQSAATDAQKASDFASILTGSKEQTVRFVKALRAVDQWFRKNNDTADLPFDPTDIQDEEQAETLEGMRTAYDDLDLISPFIRNVVLGGKDITDKAWHIISGQVAANPDLYMDLYSRASGNLDWQGGTDMETRVKQELGIEDKEYGKLTFAQRRSLAQDILDNDLRKKILAGGNVTSKELKDYVKRPEEKAAAALAEQKAIVESNGYTIDEKTKQIVRLSNKAKSLEEDLSKVQDEKSKVQEKIERSVASMERKLRTRNISTSDTLVHEDLRKALANLERREAQLRNEIARERKADTYFTKASYDEQQRIKSLIDDARKKVEDLQKKDAISTEEAVERLQSLYSVWKDERVAKALADAKARHEQVLKNLRDSKDQSKSDALRKQSKHYQDRLKEATVNKHKALKDARDRYSQAMRERQAAIRLRKEKERMARQIMKKPSANVNLDEANQIVTIQMTFDPNFRARSMNIDGTKYQVTDLKSLYAKNPDDPLFSMLTQQQIERLSKKSLDEMTLGEVEQIYNVVKALRSLGLQKRMAEVMRVKAENMSIQEALLAEIYANPDYDPTGFYGSQEDRQRGKTIKAKYTSAKLATYNMARKAQMLDGGKKGAFYNLLIRKKRLLQSVEMENQAKRIDAVMKVVKDSGIDVDDLYKTHEVIFDGDKVTKFTVADLMYVFLANNNESNHDAVAYGNLVSVSEKANFSNGARQAILGTGPDADKARRDKVNEDIRTLGDQRFNEMYAVARQVITGTPGLMDVVKAIESDFNSADFQRTVDLMAKVYNVDVEREKYYLPINRTGFVGTEPGEKLKNDLMNQVPGTKGSVEKGHTIRRQVISPMNQERIGIDLFHVWQQSVRDQEHLLADLEYVRQLNSIFENKGGRTNELREAIKNTFGESMLNAVDMHVKEIADPDAGQLTRNPADDILRLAKGNVYSAYLGFKLSSITNQLITSPAAFLGKVGPVRLASKMLEMATNWKGVTEKCFGLSTFMRNRSYDIIADEISEAASKAGGNKFVKGYNKVLDIGLSGLEYVDQYCVVAGWMAIYEQEIENLGGDETADNVAKAVAVADEYVQETQPQGDKTELAPMFKYKNEALNIILQFQSSLNVVWQNWTYDIPNAFKQKNFRMAWGTLFGYMAAGVLLGLAHKELTGKDDDDDKFSWFRFIRQFLYATTTQFTEGVPLASNQADNIVKMLVKGEKPRFGSTAIFPALEKDQQALIKLAGARDKEDFQKAMGYTAQAFALHLGFPYSAVNDLKAIPEVGWQAVLGAR